MAIQYTAEGREVGFEEEDEKWLLGNNFIKPLDKEDIADFKIFLDEFERKMFYMATGIEWKE